MKIGGRGTANESVVTKKMNSTGIFGDTASMTGTSTGLQGMDIVTGAGAGATSVGTITESPRAGIIIVIGVPVLSGRTSTTTHANTGTAMAVEVARASVSANTIASTHTHIGMVAVVGVAAASGDILQSVPRHRSFMLSVWM